MKAMIFAAGKGTRLKPLTDTIPKALVRVNNIALLENLIMKLIDTGVKDIIINVHHLAEQIISFVRAKNLFGINIAFSEEKSLLDTGGGLKNAAWFFDGQEPFIIHNVDVLSDINLKKMYNFHLNHNGSATLAVKKRETTRYLLFDSEGILIGREKEQKIITVKQYSDYKNFDRLSFLGVHIVSPKLFKYFPQDQIFSILDLYLRAAERGVQIKAWHPEQTYWFDLGKPNTLEAAENYFSSKNG